MENDVTKNEAERHVYAELLSKLAVTPFVGPKWFLPFTISASVGMFIADWNHFLDIPAPIVWLPLAMSFWPIAVIVGGIILAAAAWLIGVTLLLLLKIALHVLLFVLKPVEKFFAWRWRKKMEKRFNAKMA